MTAKLTRDSDTQVTLQITADSQLLKDVKEDILKKLQPDVSAPGFRKGKVPLNVVEKHVDGAHLEREFLDEAMTRTYRLALAEHNLKPLNYPQINIKKQVQFETLEFDAVVEVFPPIKLAKYTGMNIKEDNVKVTDEEIDQVIENIRLRLAEKKEVKRAAKEGDEAVIDFVGYDDKEKKIEGGSGNDYPLALGSKTFIKGFEEAVAGLKAGEDKSFDVTFPKDYANKSLAGKKAKFTVNVKKVMEVALPELDDDFAAKAGPFKSMAELKADVGKQLVEQKSRDQITATRNKIVEDIANKSKMTLPESVVNERVEQLKNEHTQNLVYRGQTWDEFLAAEGVTEDDYKEKVLKPEAELRTKIGLVLSEIAEKEKIEVTPEEFEVRVQVMKGQYQNPEMQAQLDDPNVRRDILQQMMSEKTVEFLYNKNVKATHPAAAEQQK